MKTTLLPLRLIWVLTSVLLAVGLPTQAAKRAAKHRRAVATPTLTFQVATNATIALGTNHSASLSDLKVGDPVVVGYDQENGALVAHHLGDNVPKKSPAASPQSGKQRPNRKGAQNLLHARGVLESVNSQAGTLTIAVKPRSRQA